jgi:hypothetical protein
MSTVIVACRTIADEVNLAIRAAEVHHPVFWIDSKLHVKPEELKRQVQATIDRIDNVSTIILGFGLCGNGLAGIRSETARLVLPKAEDCISLLLGSQEARTLLSRDAPRYFFTRGWLESENNIADEYDYCCRKYGLERAVKLMQVMLKHYRYLTFIDTGGYDITPYTNRTEKLAEILGLSHQILKGSQRFLEKLLTGPWDDEFFIANPGEVTAVEQFSGWCESIGNPEGRSSLLSLAGSPSV